MRTCETCVFFNKTPTIQTGVRDSGTCHRYPPVVLAVPQAGPNGQIAIQLMNTKPTVQMKDSCGEYQEREQWNTISLDDFDKTS